MPILNIYSFIFMFLLLIFPIIVIHRFPVKNHENTFKNYFSICFIVMCVALFISTSYLYLLYSYIDQDLIDQYVKIQYEKCISNPKCNISFEESSHLYKNHYFSISGQFQSYVFSLIPCTLYSSIISLLIKMLK